MPGMFCLSSSLFPSSSPSSNRFLSLIFSQDYSVDWLPCSSFDNIYNLASCLASSWLLPASLIDTEPACYSPPPNIPVFFQSFNAIVNHWSQFYGRFNQALPNSSCLKLCHLKFPSSPNTSQPNLGSKPRFKPKFCQVNFWVLLEAKFVSFKFRPSPLSTCAIPTATCWPSTITIKIAKLLSLFKKYQPFESSFCFQLDQPRLLFFSSLLLHLSDVQSRLSKY